jgi:hypothetical protein
MDAGQTRGPPVDAAETLYRFVPVAGFWVAIENRRATKSRWIFEGEPSLSGKAGDFGNDARIPQVLIMSNHSR